MINRVTSQHTPFTESPEHLALKSLLRSAMRFVKLGNYLLQTVNVLVSGTISLPQTAMFQSRHFFFV